MRHNRTVICPSCHARWEADRARFCGWCGVALRPAVPATDESGPPRPWRRWFLRIGGGVAAAAAIVVTAVLVDDLQLPTSRPDAAVDLAEDGQAAVVPQGDALSDTERAALLAPFDPDRLRCEPAGCEIWRFDLVEDADAGGSLEVAVLGDLVLTSAGDEITGHDLATGERRWQRSWPRLDGRPATGWTIMLADDPAGPLVLARPESGHLLALMPDGEGVWIDHEPRPLQNFQLVDQWLVTSHLERPGRRGEADEAVTFPSEQVVVRDLATGARRWERSNVAMMGASTDLVVAREGEDVLLLDTATGAELARRALADDVWFYPVGTVLLQFGSEGTQVVDRDLAPVPGLDDLTEVQPLLTVAVAGIGSGPTEAGLLFGTRRHADANTPSELVLADDDGRILWQVEVPPTSGFPELCCPQPHLVGDTIVVPVARGERTDHLRVARADGTILAGDGDLPLPAWTPTTWWLSPDVAFEQDGDRIRLHQQDRFVEVSGGGWPRNAQEPFVFDNGRSLIAVRVVGDS